MTVVAKLPEAPQKSWPIQKLKQAVLKTAKEIEALENEKITALYWRMGSCFSLWLEAGQEFDLDRWYVRDWARKQKINSTAITRAEHIFELFASQEEAAKYTLRSALELWNERQKKLAAANPEAAKAIKRKPINVRNRLTRLEATLKELAEIVATGKTIEVFAADITKVDQQLRALREKMEAKQNEAEAKEQRKKDAIFDIHHQFDKSFAAHDLEAVLPMIKRQKRKSK